LPTVGPIWPVQGSRSTTRRAKGASPIRTTPVPPGRGPDPWSAQHLGRGLRGRLPFHRGRSRQPRRFRNPWDGGGCSGAHLAAVGPDPCLPPTRSDAVKKGCRL